MMSDIPEKSPASLRRHGVAPFRVAVLHGGPGAVGEVEPLARRLGVKRGVLEPFQTELTVNGQVNEVRLILEQYADPPVVLIGHSWGAWLAFITSARHPELVDKLILIGSGPFEEKYVAHISRNRMSRLTSKERDEYWQIVKMLDNPKNTTGDDLLSRLGVLAEKADSFDIIADDLEVPVPAQSNTPCAIYQGVWPGAANLRRSVDLLRLGFSVRCPVVVIHGDCDPTPMEGVREPLAGVLCNLRVFVLDKCGHDPWRERYARDKFFSILDNELGG
jgi:pimeloyl-ACP methyl ester carboxylesterase